MTERPSGAPPGGAADRSKPAYRPAVGPRLRPVLVVSLGLFALLTVDSAYLLAVRLLGLATGETYENRAFIGVFLAHLVLGAALLLPAIVFGFAHVRNTYSRRNRRAVKVGWVLLATAIVLLASGVVLTRLEGVIDVRDPAVRRVAWWSHVLSPVAAIWLFVLHRLAGKKIRWRVGFRWAAVAVVFAAVLVAWQSREPRRWNVPGNVEGERYFFPSLARTLDGEFIAPELLRNDEYCKECHADIHEAWTRSAHRLSSFNNPPYLFSVRNTRRKAMERDGDVRASRFCAGCHDPVPFFSGRFNDPAFDDVGDPTAQAGITCTVCHAITHVNSPRGNSDYTLAAPEHYPFAFRQNRFLRWVNRQLIKSKPEFHKKTFLKPLHRTPEFCGACHKVHLPEELNRYKWLRGQNHYDTYLLSGVSGHGASSFYYPPKAEPNCNGCHMPLRESEDFGAARRDDTGRLTVHDHLFPSANTAVAVLVGHEDADAIVEAHRKFLDGVMRVDLFAVREGDSVATPPVAPIRPAVPALVPGRSYLLDVVIRTLKMGHVFTQGTADSNEVWLDVTVRAGDRVIGRSGGRDGDGRVDPWSHFANAYVLDRDGRRIDRRNAEDIFVPLYDNQIPPGAADVVHYRLDVPRDVRGAIAVDVRLQYRKFDTTYMKHVYGAEFVNDLPVVTLATDAVEFPIAPADGAAVEAPAIPEWQRWNDYGIGLLRKRGSGELRQAEEAFRRVEALGRPDGPLNLARVYLREGRVAREAPEALARAATFDPAPPAWTLLWLTGAVNQQNGNFAEAERNFREIVEGGFEQAAGRGFDFSMDYRVLNELGLALYRRGLQERGDANRPRHDALLGEAAGWFRRTLDIDPENLAAHYNLQRILTDLGDAEGAARHASAHAKYKPDDNARDRAVAAARRADPAANHAAEAVVLYDLRRPGAFELPSGAGSAP